MSHIRMSSNFVGLAKMVKKYCFKKYLLHQFVDSVSFLIFFWRAENIEDFSLAKLYFSNV